MVHPIAEANDHNPFGSLSPSEFYARHSVTHSSEFITNSRGLKLFTQSWTPLPPAKIIGTVALIHGYTSESTCFIELTAIHFAKHGFATCAIDHQGHGFSDSLDGLTRYIPDLNPVVDDCITFFDSFRSKFPNSLPSFLYGESLGGAIALLMHLRGGPSRPWNGLVLSGAMCGISAKLMPPWTEHFLTIAARIAPTWKVVFTRGSVPDMSYREEWKRRLANSSPRRRMDRLRAATGLEMLRVCRELQSRFEEVTAPFLIVHGTGDVLCDLGPLEELYRRAVSKDKTIRVYPGMWHQLIGEPEENIELVFGEIVEWLKIRAERDAATHVAAGSDDGK